MRADELTLTRIFVNSHELAIIRLNERKLALTLVKFLNMFRVNNSARVCMRVFKRGP